MNFPSPILFPDTRGVTRSAALPEVEEGVLGCLSGIRSGLAECLVEVAGGGLLVDHLLRKQRERREFVALVDGADAFDPAAVEEPCLLEHLLWARCRGVDAALLCADALLRDENFPLVIMDLLGVPVREVKRVPLSNWYRLQHLCHTGRSGLVLTRQVCIPAAQFRMSISGDFCLGDLDSPRALLFDALSAEVLKRAGSTEGLNLVKIG